MNVTIEVDTPSLVIEVGDIVEIVSKISGSNIYLVMDMGDRVDAKNRYQLMAFDGWNRWNYYSSLKEMAESLEYADHINDFTIYKQQNYKLVLKAL